MQLDVASPAAVTASTTGIAVVQSVVELTSTSAVSLVRLSLLALCPHGTMHAPDALSVVPCGLRRTPPRHAPSTATPQTQHLEQATHSSRLMASRLRGSW